MADDDIRADLMAAFEAPDATPAASTEVPTIEDAAPPAIDTTTVKPADDRPRNPDGTFAPKAQEAPSVAPGATKTEATAAPTATAADKLTPPSSWKGAGKIDWQRLPKAVQQEILAESDRFGNIEKQFAAYQQVVGPRAAQLAAEYGSPEQAIGQLFALSDFAAKDPRGFLHWFAQSRGIDLGGGAPPAQQQQAPQVDPALLPVLRPLYEQVDSISRQLQATQASAQQQTFSANLDSVQAFCADPANPYVNDVWEDMVALMESGRVQRGPNALKEAYDRATWASPTVRAHMLEAQKEREKAEQAAQVQRARQAGATLTGSPLPGASTSAALPERDLKDELIANARELAGWRV